VLSINPDKLGLAVYAGWEQVGDALLDGIRVIALAAKERPAEYFAVFPLGNTQFEWSLAYRANNYFHY
jgi:hypothetical protein